MGARGYCSTSVRSCLFALGFSNKRVKDALQRFGRVALECSFHIWLCRNTREWTFDEEHPWEDFRNPIEITKSIAPVPKISVPLEPDNIRDVVGKPAQSQDPIRHKPAYSDRYTKSTTHVAGKPKQKSKSESGKPAKAHVV